MGAELRRRVASTSWSPILDPQLSPDGCTIAYVRDDELIVVPITCGEPIQITFGARGTGKVSFTSSLYLPSFLLLISAFKGRSAKVSRMDLAPSSKRDDVRLI